MAGALQITNCSNFITFILTHRKCSKNSTCVFKTATRFSNSSKSHEERQNSASRTANVAGGELTLLAVHEYQKMLLLQEGTFTKPALPNAKKNVLRKGVVKKIVAFANHIVIAKMKFAEIS